LLQGRAVLRTSFGQEYRLKTHFKVAKPSFLFKEAFIEKSRLFGEVFKQEYPVIRPKIITAKSYEILSEGKIYLKAKLFD